MACHVTFYNDVRRCKRLAATDDASTAFQRLNEWTVPITIEYFSYNTCNVEYARKQFVLGPTSLDRTEAVSRARKNITTSMATATATQTEQKVTECSICDEPFKQPKILPCGHLLCRGCLVTRLRSHLPSCPVCGCQVTQHATYHGRASEVIADTFPTDHTMEAWVEAHRVLSQPHRCCVCVDKAALGVCINCSDMFCATCSLVHTRQSATSHHRLENLSSTTAETLAASQPSTCDVHRDQASQLYCPTHDAAICILCATADHRQCLGVVKLESKMGEVHRQLAELAQILQAGERALEQAIAEVGGELSDLDARGKAAVAEIDATFDSLQAAMRVSRDRLKRQAESEFRRARRQVGERQTLLLDRKGKVTPYTAIVRRAKAFRTLGGVRTLAAVMQDRVHQLDLTTTLPFCVEDVHVPAVTFDLDPQAVARVKEDLSTLGLPTTSTPKAPSTPKTPRNPNTPNTPRTPKTPTLPNTSNRPGAVAATGVPPLRFHDNHGRQIKLSKNLKVAERTSPVRGDAIVMSRDPMTPDMLYQVKIDRVDERYDSTVLGVVTQKPDTLYLPETFYSRPLHHEALVVGHDGVAIFGVLNREKHPALLSLPAGSSVGLALHRDRRLHLYVNGEHQGGVATGLPSPCYFLFELFSRCTKVTALPVTPVP